MRNFKKIVPVICLFFSLSVFANDSVEKIIIVRHGEKPSVEIGQLNCKGLNRSLQLPNYFKTHFPKPNTIFAPNPSVKIDHKYSYIRPLATIEPTAIQLDMPVNAEIGFNQPQHLMNELLKSRYHPSVIYVAWEHHNIQTLVRMMLKQFNNNASVPTWPTSDFNRVYLVTIHWNTHPATIDFAIASENMHHLSAQCPQV